MVLSIRWRLTVLMLALVLGLGTIVLGSLWVLMRAQLAQQMQTSVESTRGLIAQILHARTEALQGQTRLVADLPTLKAAIVSNSQATVQERMRAYGGMITADSLLVTDADGRTMATTRLSSKTNLNNDPAVNAALDGKEWSEVRVVQGKPVLVTGTPILVSGYPRGSLIAFVNIGQRLAITMRQALSAEVAFTVGSKVVGSSTALGPTLNVITDHPSEVQVGDNSYEALRSPLPQQNGKDTAAFVVLRNMRDFTQSYIRYGTIFAIILGITSLGALYAAARFARRITTPLERVVGAAKVLRAGEWPETFEVEGEDEIAVLQRTFNDMTASLKASFHLESKNEELTAALNEAEEANLALKKARKMEAIGILSAGIAHEINTPTQFVRDNVRFFEMAFERMVKYLQSVEKCLQPGEETDKLEQVKKSCRLDQLVDEVPRAITECTEGVDRIAEIVQGLKHYAHPGVGGHVDANLNTVINSCVLISRNEWKYNAKLETNLATSLHPVNGLAGQLGQVIINLIVNSAHAVIEAGRCPDTGSIRISTEQVDDFARLVIEDNGCGMSPEVLSHVFELGFTTKDVGIGTGMGLSIARGIIEGNGGKMKIESEVGIGTKITMHIPLSESVIARTVEAA